MYSFIPLFTPFIPCLGSEMKKCETWGTQISIHGLRCIYTQNTTHIWTTSYLHMDHCTSTHRPLHTHIQTTEHPHVGHCVYKYESLNVSHCVQSQALDYGKRRLVLPTYLLSRSLSPFAMDSENSSTMTLSRSFGLSGLTVIAHLIHKLGLWV